jgi:hypothetical protein
LPFILTVTTIARADIIDIDNIPSSIATKRQYSAVDKTMPLMEFMVNTSAW